MLRGRAVLAAHQSRLCASGTSCTQATLWSASGGVARPPCFVEQFFSMACPRSWGLSQKPVETIFILQSYYRLRHFFSWPAKTIYTYVDASCERCSRPIKPNFAPPQHRVHRLHFGPRAAVSRALRTSCSSSSPWRVRGVGVELKNLSKPPSSCRTVAV